MAEQIITNEHARLIAPDHARRRLAAPQITLIHHIIMKQGGRVHELNRGRELYMRVPLEAAHARGCQRQHGPQPFAAGIDEMQRQFRDHIDMGSRARQDRLVDLFHILGRKRQQRIQTRATLLTALKGNHYTHTDLTSPVKLDVGCRIEGGQGWLQARHIDHDMPAPPVAPWPHANHR